MIFKTQPFEKSSRRKEYFEFINQPFHIGMVGLVAGQPYEDQEPFLEDWYGVPLVNWLRFSNEQVKIEFYDHKNFYKIENPKLMLQKEFTFPHPRTLMEFLSDMDRCEVESNWSPYIVETIDMKFLLSVEDFKAQMDELLEKIGKGDNDIGGDINNLL